jgi:hypothetical protein
MQSAAIGTPERGVFSVGFNAYVVPDGDHPSYPPFCSPACRSPEHHDGSVRARDSGIPARSTTDEGGRWRGAIPAQEYQSGNIALAVDLEPLAKYNILLIGNNEVGDPETLVTIPLESGGQGILSISARAPAGDF